MSPLQNRANSIAKAKALGIIITNGLPFLDEALSLRTCDEAVSRLLAMSAVAASAFGFDRLKALAWLEKEELLGSLSVGEVSFVREGLGDPNPFRWQVEGMWALAWALGYIGELDFTKDCDGRFVTLLPNLKINQPGLAFRQRAQPRQPDMVVGALDLAYCLHWAVRQAQIDNQPPPANLVPSRIVERRRALEWLLSGTDWDQVVLDT